MSSYDISSSIRYIGVDDKTLDLFESQYVIPNGISYNSYVILDEAIAVMDTCDARATETWLSNLSGVLDGKAPDYLVISHMEPDHSANATLLMERYPQMKVVASAGAFTMLTQFSGQAVSPERKVVVKEGDTLSLGSHTLRFIAAPMVHWPEVMFSYEEQEKVLFSADAFGKFGALDADEDWACEARRYYMNIVGKYGAQVQAVLKKAAALDIQTICPLHGPILTENLPYYLNLYNTWSSYQPENSGIVIAFASIHGNTRAAVEELRVMLSQDGTKVSCFDLARDDMAEVIEDAFRYDRLVLASPTYDGGLFPPMEDLLYHLKSKNFQNRTIGIVENGSWAPTAGKLMRAYAEGFKNCTLVEPVVTIRSALNEKSREQLSQLAAALKQ
jgi:flavorubredoxin